MRVMKELLAEYRRVSLTLAGVLIILLLVTVFNIFAGLPDPRRPASDLFDNPDTASWIFQDESSQELTDFSERPLFSATRRIKVRPAASEAAPKSEPAGPILTLDKWSLLGIFDSGEVEGALIRHPESGRHRLVVGERVGGWELTSVDPRSVRFESVAGGSQAELRMALATVKILPVPSGKSAAAGAATPTAEQRREAADAAERPQAADAAEAAIAPKPITPSFGDYYGGSGSKQD